MRKNCREHRGPLYLAKISMERGISSSGRYGEETIHRTSTTPARAIVFRLLAVIVTDAAASVIEKRAVAVFNTSHSLRPAQLFSQARASALRPGLIFISQSYLLFLTVTVWHTSSSGAKTSSSDSTVSLLGICNRVLCSCVRVTHTSFFSIAPLYVTAS